MGGELEKECKNQTWEYRKFLESMAQIQEFILQMNQRAGDEKGKK